MAPFTQILITSCGQSSTHGSPNDIDRSVTVAFVVLSWRHLCCYSLRSRHRSKQFIGFKTQQCQGRHSSRNMSSGARSRSWSRSGGSQRPSMSTSRPFEMCWQQHCENISAVLSFCPFCKATGYGSRTLETCLECKRPVVFYQREPVAAIAARIYKHQGANTDVTLVHKPCNDKEWLGLRSSCFRPKQG